MTDSDVLNEGQPQAPAGLVVGAASVHVAENFRALFFCNGISTVVHRDDDAAMGFGNADRHHGVTGAIFQRIAY